MSVRSNSRRFVVLAGVMAAGAAAGGIATAAIPDENDVFHACVRTEAGSGGAIGDIRMIDTALNQLCNQAEKRVAWNQRGRVGDAGPQGPAGAAGSNANIRAFHFDRVQAIKLGRAKGTPVGTFDVPEGKWEFHFSGEVSLPAGVQRVRGASRKATASLNFARNRTINFGRVECTMAVGGTQSTATVGDEGVVLPAVQRARAAAVDMFRGVRHETLTLNFVASVPAGGGQGTLACGYQTGGAAGLVDQGATNLPQASLSNMQLNFAEVGNIRGLNFTVTG